MSVPVYLAWRAYWRVSRQKNESNRHWKVNCDEELVTAITSHTETQKTQHGPWQQQYQKENGRTLKVQILIFFSYIWLFQSKQSDQKCLYWSHSLKKTCTCVEYTITCISHSDPVVSSTAKESVLPSRVWMCYFINYQKGSLIHVGAPHSGKSSILSGGSGICCFW